MRRTPTAGAEGSLRRCEGGTGESVYSGGTTHWRANAGIVACDLGSRARVPKGDSPGDQSRRSSGSVTTDGCEELPAGERVLRDEGNILKIQLVRGRDAGVDSKGALGPFLNRARMAVW